MKTKKIELSQQQRMEIEMLRCELLQHGEEYNAFKSFKKTSDDAVIIADALLNNDYKTFKKYSLKYTKHTAEKMRGMQSLSTYKKTSSICLFLKQHGGICSKCYADRSISLYRAALIPALIYNTLLLKYIDIDASQIPYINDRFFRFEAFSDLQSSKHLKNLLAVCNKNKNTFFTLWSKAGYSLVKMMEDEKITRLPSNFNIVHSEFYINKKTDKEYLEQLQSCLYPQQAIKNKYSNALKCFVVYDNENLRQQSGMHLCKNRCVECLKCYKKSKNIIYIAEKIH